MSPKEIVPGGVYQVVKRLYRVIKIEDGYVHWEYENGKPRGGKLGGKIKLSGFAQRATLPESIPPPPSVIEIPKVVPLVKDPEDVIISSHDHRLLRMLADDASDRLITFGTSADSVKRACVSAFRLGFTARSRGEAVQEHPPAPDWQRPAS